MDLSLFKKLTVALGSIVFCSLVHSAEVFKYDRVDLNDFLKQEEAKQQVITKRNREKYVRLRSNGGRVIDSDRPRPACISEGYFVQYMTFVMYGDGNLPSKDQCWELQTGESLIMPDHGDYSHPPICNDTYSVCRFKYDSLLSFKGEFYTAIYIVNPY